MDRAVPRRDFTALVLAGQRPDEDSFGAGAGAVSRVLMPVGGVAMLIRVVRALRTAKSINRIVVCGMDPAAVNKQEELRPLVSSGELVFLDSRATPSASVLHAMKQLADPTPLLVTTADHPLLTAEMIDYFCTSAAADPCDVAAAVVAADLLQSTFPNTVRTFLRFRDNAYCGCNLFALLNPTAQRAPAAWMEIERHRKRPWRMIRALGVTVLLRFLFRRLTLDAAVEQASRKIGVRARAILLPYPEAAIDVDKPADLALAEEILRNRD